MIRLKLLIAAALATMAATAQAAQPIDWGLWFQNAASARMRDIAWFGEYTSWIVGAIAIFVTALLAWVMIRYNARVNKTPTKTSHNTVIEILWTVVPVLILIVIAIPSFRLLFNQLEIPEAEVTVKATGYQWYWGYEYPDGGDIQFDSVMLSDDERAQRQEQMGWTDKEVPRLLAVDNEMVVPVGKVVVLQVTAEDVLHAFAMPALGLKLDAIPGRLNQTWFKAEKEGVYFGQCSELCGRGHAYMPIAIRVVSEDRYQQWLTAAADDLEAANQMLAGWIAADKTKFAQATGN